MYNDTQKGIIKAVSKLLFQEEDLEYWVRPKEVDDTFSEAYRGVCVRNDVNNRSYWLYLEKIRDINFIAVAENIGSDYDDEDVERIVLGYIRINPNRKVWAMASYCKLIESFIEDYD